MQDCYLNVLQLELPAVLATFVTVCWLLTTLAEYRGHRPSVLFFVHARRPSGMVAVPLCTTTLLRLQSRFSVALLHDLALKYCNGG